MLNYLRITVTALGLAACVLLVALWVRSYRNGISSKWLFLDRQHITFHSQSANLYLIWRTENRLSPNQTFIADELDNELASQLRDLIERNKLAFSRTRFSMSCPHWFAALIAAVISLAPWLPWRFSLRTLLVVTTLVALGLGVIAMAS
jgi:hypothetical protein